MPIVSIWQLTDMTLIYRTNLSDRFVMRVLSKIGTVPADLVKYLIYPFNRQITVFGP